MLLLSSAPSQLLGFAELFQGLFARRAVFVPPQEGTARLAGSKQQPGLYLQHLLPFWDRITESFRLEKALKVESSVDPDPSAELSYPPADQHSPPI